MNDLVEQYNLELRYQEKKSNVRTLRSFLWFFIAMVVTWGSMTDMDIRRGTRL